MSDHVWVIRTQDYLEQVGDQPFIGLPREEIDRLYGAIAVLRLDRVSASRDDTYLPLVTFSALHYNYAWVTRPHMLGMPAAIPADGEAPVFLDAAYDVFARRELERLFVLPPCELRLAGLLRADQLGLVYIARLRQRDIESRETNAAIRVRGNNELGFARAEFEPWSQLLIDNLHAL
jgi:hypothetical protein